MSEALWPMTPITSCAISFEDGTSLHYDAVFTPEFFSELSSIIRIDMNLPNLTLLREAHAEATASFYAAKSREASRKTVKQENHYLEEISHHAEALFGLLAGLAAYPDAKVRLVDEIKQNPSAFLTTRGESLSGLLDEGREHEFLTLQQLISDLWASSERSQIRNSDRANFENMPSALLTQLGALDKLPFPKLEATTSLDSFPIKYRKKTAPIISFISNFSDSWGNLTNQSYGPGMHLRESRTTKSAAVDAILLSMKYLNEPYTRAEIVTSFRSWMKADEAPSQN